MRDALPIGILPNYVIGLNVLLPILLDNAEPVIVQQRQPVVERPQKRAHRRRRQVAAVADIAVNPVPAAELHFAAPILAAEP